MNFTAIAGDKKHRIVRISTLSPIFKIEVPAFTEINKRTISGRIVIDKSGFKFIANDKGVNYDVWLNPKKYPVKH